MLCRSLKLAVCSFNKQRDEEWHRKHKDSDACEINFDGPNTSMETEAAKIL